ncbi:LNS2/PITP domain-containing protein [Caenorhabditis elegans]|uniref:LNS2/PITP domain-containing protein n=1 Tax=Caenorhabditis elegans TaxID=6239 RepID=Q9XXT5_CAEEL|nr:LNS2/PITP domain-containing protein [Caenorhabditis elegans]CAA16154.2 LNS2/PITP domain-containing protein [Caenorhabditis elegans]|eukprot:NP_506380.2 LiPIN (mammalian lipodystrophy associated) homolog [Caenorhabditis elegans]
MDYAYRVFKNVKYFYNSINPATLSGAIDVVVVEQPNGEYKSTPFHVRFGKYGVFSYSDKYVDIAVNGVEIDLKMKLADSGVAFFVEEADDQVPDYLLTSPLPEQETPQTAGPAVDKVLAESARKLEETQNENEDVDMNDIAKSRSSSPDGGQGNAREPKQEQSLSQVQRKQTLPFSSSVFSDRRYRSLPDLTVLAAETEVERTDIKKSDGKRTRKTPRPFVHSHSQCSPMEKKHFHKSNDEILRSLRRETHDMDRRIPLRKKSRVTFNQQATRPIDIKIQQYNDSDSELDSSVNSSPSPSLVDQREADRIADGALSDSEVDRQRDRNATPEPHDVTDWKWGELPETREQNKRKKQDEDAEKSTSRWSSWFWRSSTSTADEEQKEKEKLEQEEQGISLDELLNSSSNPVEIEKYLGKPPSVTSIDSGHVSRGVSQPSSPISNHDDYTPTTTPPNDKTPTRESVRFGAGNDIPSSTSATNGVRSRASSDEIFPLSEDELDDNFRPQYMQSLRLSSEKLKSLGLVFGANELRFSITTKFQGTTWCSCNIYLYKWYEQIVVSDIDGTITKSDVLGHVIPAIGGTWAHTGVAELYTRIKNNGYKMVYLSSRAIGQSHTTKQYLKSVAQDSKQLPDGPVLLSPTSIITAFRREVIERRPEEFKIAALTDLKQLFPSGNPFYAGFGNRITDVVSYEAVAVPAARILIIDPSGKVKRSDSSGLALSYKSMASDTVDYMFPPLSVHVKGDARKTERLTSTWSKPLEHSNFTHWHMTPKDVHDDELLEYEAQRKKLIAEQKAKK